MIRTLPRLFLLTLLAFVAICAGHKHERCVVSDSLLNAIRMVESGGKDDVKDGDGGKAIGEYQIHRGYFDDAAKYDKSLGDDYQKCRERAFAERVVRAYMARYLPAGASDEDIARVHNGGCGILKRKGSKAWNATTRYWEKVKKHL